MSDRDAPPPPRVLQEVNRDGSGNRLLLYEIEGRPALLKVYRARSGRAREWAKRFSYLVLERKRGVTARERCALERAQLALWRRCGFDVPALLSHPLPEGYSADTATWLEYCPGPTLRSVASDRSLPIEQRERELARFGETLAARQRRVLETGELGLVMKHASLKHVLCHAARQVHFDLESAHAAGVDVRDALADELAALVRSLLRAVRADERERLGAALLEGHADPKLLREIASRALDGALRRRLQRLSDRLRRGELGKYAALEWVRARL